MSSLFNKLSGYINIKERLCRFFVNRLLRDFLGQVGVDQLSTSLTGGEVSISDTQLKVELLNEKLEHLGLPFTITDAFIEKLAVQVPWTSLVNDSCQMTLSNVELTLRTKEGFMMDSQALERSVRQIMTTNGFVQSFIEEEKEEHAWNEDNEEQSVAALKEVVEAFSSRFNMSIDGCIVRVETPTSEDLILAMEIQADSIKVEDSITWEKRTGQKYEGTPSESGLPTIMNTLSGVSLHTDLFDGRSLAEMVSLSQFGPRTSLSVRRQCSMNASLTESIQSIKEQHFTIIYSDPTKVAQFDEDIMCVITLGKAESNEVNQVTADLTLGSIRAFLLPSQLELIKEVVNNVSSHFATQSSSRNCSKFDVFGHYEEEEESMNSSDNCYMPARGELAEMSLMTSISLDEPVHSLSLHQSTQQSFVTAKQSHVAKIENWSSPSISLSFALSSATVVVPYTDQVVEEVVTREGKSVMMRRMKDYMKEHRDKFFQQRHTGEDHTFDHLKLSLSDVDEKLILKSMPSSCAQIDLNISRIQLDECLSNDSTSVKTECYNRMNKQSQSGIPSSVPILLCSSSDGNGGHALSLFLFKSENQFECRTSLAKCVLDLDISIVDRIAPLMHYKPFLPSIRKFMPSSRLETIDEDATLSPSRPSLRPSSPCSFNIDDMTVNIRVPQSSFLHHSTRTINDDHFRLCTKNISFSFPLDQSSDCRSYDFSIEKVQGFFVMGDQATSMLTSGRIGSSGDIISVKVVLDERKKGLERSEGMYSPTIHEEDKYCRSIVAALVKESKKNEKSPFSNRKADFIGRNTRGETIVRAGTRKEMQDFSSDCIAQSLISVSIVIPHLTVIVPSNNFLRRLTDQIEQFLSWSPRSPLNRGKISVQVDCSYRPSIYGQEGEAATLRSEDNVEESHILSVKCVVNSATVSLGTAMHSTESDVNNVIIDLTSLEAFLCYGFHGDLSQSFMYLTNAKLVLAHCNSVPMDFKYGQQDVRLCPNKIDLRSDAAGDTVGIAVQLISRPQGNQITCAFALRFLEAMLTPFHHPNELWFIQLQKFFDLGERTEELPIRASAHLHLDNVAVTYDHSLTNDKSGLIYTLQLGCMDVNTTIDAREKKNQLFALLEQLKFMVKRTDTTSKNASAPQFVNLLSIDPLQIELYALNVAKVGRRDGAILEVNVNAGDIKAWLCADSLAALVNTAVEISQSPLWPSRGVKGQRNKQGRAPVREVAKKTKHVGGMVEWEMSGKMTIQDLLKTGPEYMFVEEESSDMPSDGAIPLLKLTAECTLMQLHLFGGNDHGSEPSSKQTFSSTKKPDVKEEDAIGGEHRDHSVCVVLELAKMSLAHEDYEIDSPVRTLQYIGVGGVTVHDRLTKTAIKGLLYKDEKLGEKPKRVQKLLRAHVVKETERRNYKATRMLIPCNEFPPMFAYRMAEDHIKQRKVNVSLQSVRVNIDEDTLDFLLFFAKDCGARLVLPDHKVPITEVADWDASAEDTDGDPSLDIIDIPPEQPHSNLYPKLEVPQDSLPDQSKPNACFIDRDPRDEPDTEEVFIEPRPSLQEGNVVVFYEEFVFYPTASVRVDYNGKGRAVQSGMWDVFGLLKGATNLSLAELRVKELKSVKGFKSLERCLQFCVDEWERDNKERIPGLVSSLTPIAPIMTIGKGFYDLVWHPYSMWKSDGNIVDGLRIGGGSFGSSTAATVLGFAQMFAGVVQGASEMALRRVDGSEVAEMAEQPVDLKHGAQLALGTMMKGFKQSRREFEDSEKESMNDTYLTQAKRFAVPYLLRPIVYTAQASSQIIGGMRNQLRPGQFVDDERKWKH